MSDNNRESESFIWLATRPSVAKRAVKIAMIVGVILALINHGDTFISGSLNLDTIAKILLTFLVPYSVSIYSSVLAIRERSQFLKPR